MKHSKTISALAVLACMASTAGAQSSVTIYGDIDQYLNYMHSSSGAHVKALEDGAYLRSRIGFRGIEDLGDGYSAKFQLEGGFSADNGTQADAANNRFFDRQTWVGLASPNAGEIRFGRQNGPIQSHGAYIDYTARDLGSMINNFGVPSRYDNDISYLSPRWAGFAFEAHVALPESPVGNHPLIYQAFVDYTWNNSHIGYMGLRARPPSNAAIDKDVVYDNPYIDFNYGKGNIYIAYVRSNNNTSSGTGATLINNGGTLVSNVGGTSGGAGSYNPGTNPDLNNFYNIWQISADYQASAQFRIGALWGKIKDTSGRDRGASGGSFGGFYDLSKRTMFYGLIDTLRNDTNGGWRPAGSAGLKTTFTAANDVNGRTINGIQLGILHRF